MRWLRSFVDFSSLLLLVGVLGVLSSKAEAALIDDGPTCRCLDNLTMAGIEGLDEDIRREAARILDDYCDQNRPLSDLSGSAQWIAQESCMLLHREFLLETDPLLDESDTGGVELRISVRADYVGRRVINDYLVDWRHHMAVYARLHITLRPMRLRTDRGGSR